ncbi:hypothetical protein CesoFtcFv8_005510 [Champsocephalus esox]|uniref:Uncharacterized protein n=1 Tax=Champsocephalus esox TaxID=159716 RepID=A0AAN8CPY2_9TELE|nr:hypothetical protein CesoFtcFv8_005510 [Champsocephalus esox]
MQTSFDTRPSKGPEFWILKPLGSLTSMCLLFPVQAWAGGLAMYISGSVLMASSVLVLPVILIGAPLYAYGLVLSVKNSDKSPMKI